jgi:hypothetical protein
MAAIAPLLSASVLPAKSVADAKAKSAADAKGADAKAKSAADAKDSQFRGLTDGEAHCLLQKFGPNAMPDTGAHPFRTALAKFWAPGPWMLEAAIVLELVLGKDVEAAIIAGLLLFNAALGLFQESRAQATLAAPKSRLALSASVRRDGAWKIINGLDIGGRRARNDAFAGLARGRHGCGGGCLRIRPGFPEGSRIRPSRDRIAAVYPVFSGRGVSRCCQRL